VQEIYFFFDDFSIELITNCQNHKVLVLVVP